MLLWPLIIINFNYVVCYKQISFRLLKNVLSFVCNVSIKIKTKLIKNIYKKLLSTVCIACKLLGNCIYHCIVFCIFLLSCYCIHKIKKHIKNQIMCERPRLKVLFCLLHSWWGEWGLWVCQCHQCSQPGCQVSPMAPNQRGSLYFSWIKLYQRDLCLYSELECCAFFASYHRNIALKRRLNAVF